MTSVGCCGPSRAFSPGFPVPSPADGALTMSLPAFMRLAEDPARSYGLARPSPGAGNSDEALTGSRLYTFAVRSLLSGRMPGELCIDGGLAYCPPSLAIDGKGWIVSVADEVIGAIDFELNGFATAALFAPGALRGEAAP